MLKLWLLGGGLLVGFADLGAARNWVRDFIRTVAQRLTSLEPELQRRLDEAMATVGA